MLCQGIEGVWGSLIENPLYFIVAIVVVMCAGPGLVIGSMPMLINGVFNLRFRRQVYYAIALIIIGIVNVRLLVWAIQNGEDWYRRTCL
ncbi:MAG: hypothetical protein AAF215_03960 [Cyanobacteria bacterium P01_A01_bin.123]